MKKAKPKRRKIVRQASMLRDMARHLGLPKEFAPRLTFLTKLSSTFPDALKLDRPGRWFDVEDYKAWKRELTTKLREA